MANGGGRVIAGLFALSAFAVAIVAGLAAGNNAAQIMLRAIVAMVLCYPLGFLIGSVCEYVIDSHVSAHARRRAEASAANASEGKELPAKPTPDEDVIVV